MSLNGLLRQLVSIYNESSLDKHGRQTFGDATMEYARMQVGRKTRLLPNSEVMLIDAVCFLLPNTVATRGSKVNYDSVDYKVMEIAKVIGGTGTIHHMEAELQKWQ